MATTKKTAPRVELENPVLRFDAMVNDEWPNGAWCATVDDVNPDNVYDCFYGATPNDALAAYFAQGK